MSTPLPLSIRDIDLLALRPFIATVEGSLVRSAGRMSISPSSISRRSATLKKIVVLRSCSGATGGQPTAAGEMLYARFKALTDLLE